jgi:hypothetical protein
MTRAARNAGRAQDGAGDLDRDASVDIAGVQKLPKASRPGTTATASHQEPPATLPSSSD